MRKNLDKIKCILAQTVVVVRGLNGSVVFVCVLWYRNVSSEGADWVCCVCECVLWYRNVSIEGADCVCLVCVMV